MNKVIGLTSERSGHPSNSNKATRFCPDSKGSDPNLSSAYCKWNLKEKSCELEEKRPKLFDAKWCEVSRIKETACGFSPFWDGERADEMCMGLNKTGYTKNMFEF